MECIEIIYREVSKEAVIHADSTEEVPIVASDAVGFVMGVSTTPEPTIHVSVQGHSIGSFIVCSLAKIFSCFGGGGWINGLPWIDRDIWKNE